jgi:hypothetical protein
VVDGKKSGTVVSCISRHALHLDTKRMKGDASFSYLNFECSFVTPLRKKEDSYGDSDCAENENNSNEPPGSSHVQFFDLNKFDPVDVSVVRGTRHGMTRLSTFSGCRFL